MTERPLRKDAERNRQRIMQAAQEVFALRGLEASLDDVADHAGVGIGTVYRRFANKESLVEAIFEERIDQLVAIATESQQMDDSWLGFASFLERACAEQANDRGLREVVLGSAYSTDRMARVRDRMIPEASKLLHRAQADGHVRADLQPTDIPLIVLTISSVADYTRHTESDTWRRYLAIVLDGLRTARPSASPLPAPALDIDEVEAAMRHWHPSARAQPK
jgi:AcrR family transcriptional regulator